LSQEEDSEYSDLELFVNGDMIVLNLKDGRHYLGEYFGHDDIGVYLRVEAKTEMMLVKAATTKFENMVENLVQEEVKYLISPKDWLQKAVELSRGKITYYDMEKQSMSLSDLKMHVLGSMREIQREKVGKIWTGPREEPDVTKPYLRPFKRSVRTIVAWHKIDEVVSATELAEEAEIADLSNLIDNGEFLKLIEAEEN
jgi:hypothetical protein